MGRLWHGAVFHRACYKRCYTMRKVVVGRVRRGVCPVKRMQKEEGEGDLGVWVWLWLWLLRLTLVRSVGGDGGIHDDACHAPALVINRCCAVWVCVYGWMDGWDGMDGGWRRRGHLLLGINAPCPVCLFLLLRLPLLLAPAAATYVTAFPPHLRFCVSGAALGLTQ